MIGRVDETSASFEAWAPRLLPDCGGARCYSSAPSGVMPSAPTTSRITKPKANSARQPLIDIEKAQLAHRPSANQNLTHQIRKSRRKCATRATRRCEPAQFIDGRRLRILVVVDDCTRECLALVPDTSISGIRVARGAYTATFAVTHPRWEPCAGKPHVRFCAGARDETRVPTATVGISF
jgi:hypothetical protein